MLSISGYNKPAVILAGGVIEELLRLFLKNKSIKPTSNKLNDYIKECEKYKLIGTAIHRLADSVRQFRNYVHLEKENSNRQSISKPIAKGAVSSIFAIASDFTFGWCGTAGECGPATNRYRGKQK